MTDLKRILRRLEVALNDDGLFRDLVEGYSSDLIIELARIAGSDLRKKLLLIDREIADPQPPKTVSEPPRTQTPTPSTTYGPHDAEIMSHYLRGESGRFIKPSRIKKSDVLLVKTLTGDNMMTVADAVNRGGYHKIPEMIGNFPSGGPKANGFASQSMERLVRSGLGERTKGLWKLTPLGVELQRKLLAVEVIQATTSEPITHRKTLRKRIARRPGRGELYQKAWLKAFHSKMAPLRRTDTEYVYKQIRDHLTSEDHDTLASGKIRWRKDVDWALYRLAKEKFIKETPGRRGYWELTPKGVKEGRTRRERNQG